MGCWRGAVSACSHSRTWTIGRPERRGLGQDAISFNGSRVGTGRPPSRRLGRDSRTAFYDTSDLPKADALMSQLVESNALFNAGSIVILHSH